MGLGRFGGGVDVAKFAAGAGAKVTVTDLAPAEQLSGSLKQLEEFDNIEYHLGSHCASDFEQADIRMLLDLFNQYEAEAERIIKVALVLPAYEYCLKCSHTFNLLDARGAISVTERTGYIARIRNLVRACAEAYLGQREKIGFPLMG